MIAKWVGSPNYGDRRGYVPIAMVYHIMDGTLAGTDHWLQNKSSGVSYHYGIGSYGQIHQYVKEEYAAWHAGVVERPTWELYKNINPNYVTIGIACEGRPGDPISDDMLLSLIALTKDVLSRHDRIADNRRHLIGHYEIWAIQRANCPGPSFPWEKLMRGIITETPIVVPEWKARGFEWLRDNFLTSDAWEATDPVDIGTLGSILSRAYLTGRKWD